MDLEPDADQVALIEELRRALSAGATWDQLAEMGIFALPVPEADGGAGLGWGEAALAFEQLGRARVAGPYVSTAAATAAGLAEGVTGIIPVHAPTFVEHLDALDTLLVIAPDGVHRTCLPLDGGTPVARPLDPGTPVHVFAAVPNGELIAEPHVARTLARHAALLAAAMQVGLGLDAVETATAYAQQRRQFDRPIGSFQAVKHLLADAIVALEVARAAVDAAAVSEDECDVHAGRAVAAARVVASDAAARAARTCIQVHGGMGYTWELGVHINLKRTLALDCMPSTVDDALCALEECL